MKRFLLIRGLRSTGNLTSLGSSSLLGRLGGGLVGVGSGELLGLTLGTGVLGGLAALLDLSGGDITGSLALLGLLLALLLDGGNGDSGDSTLDLGDLTGLLAGNQVLLGLVHLTVDGSPAELGGLVLGQEEALALGVAEEQDAVIRTDITDSVSGVHLVGGE